VPVAYCLRVCEFTPRPSVLEIWFLRDCRSLVSCHYKFLSLHCSIPSLTSFISPSRKTTFFGYIFLSLHPPNFLPPTLPPNNQQPRSTRGLFTLCLLPEDSRKGDHRFTPGTAWCLLAGHRNFLPQAISFSRFPVSFVPKKKARHWKSFSHLPLLAAGLFVPHLSLGLEAYHAISRPI
jgi:hypothetical protein